MGWFGYGAMDGDDGMDLKKRYFPSNWCKIHRRL